MRRRRGEREGSERQQRIYGDAGTLSAERHRWDDANPGNRAIVAERAHATIDLLRRADLWPPAERRVLEVGCGTGGELARFVGWGADPSRLFGVDIVADRIHIAAASYPAFRFAVGDGAHLPYAGGSFHLVLLSTVLSSVVDEDVQRGIAAEVDRVLGAGGAVLWYDFRVSRPQNPDTRGIGVRRLRELFPSYRPLLETVTVAPPISRRLGPTTGVLYPLLARIPWLRTHVIGVLRKPPGAAAGR